MGATWDIIRNTLEKHHALFSELPDKTEFSGVRVYGDAVARSEGLLYIVRGRRALAAALNAGFSNIISVGGELLPGVCALLPEETEFQNELQELFDRLSELEIQLALAGMSGDFGRMTLILANFTGKRVILFDRSLHMIALAPDVDCPEDKEWMHVRKYGYSSAETVRKLYESGALAEMQSFTQPAARTTRVDMPYNTIVTNIATGALLEARLLIIGISFEPEDYYAARLFSDYYLRTIEARGRGRENVGDTMFSFFYSLITGVALSRELISATMPRLIGWDGDSFRVLCVKLDVADEHFEFYTRQLVERLRAYFLNYEGTLVAVINCNRNEYAEQTEPRLVAWLESNSVYGGISGEYSDLNETYANYRRALLALKYEGDDKRLRLFDDCALELYFSELPEDRAELYRHPAIKHLREFDESNATSYSETLKVYLSCERSLVKTAKSLYIHRNTVQYRLNQIQDIIHFDLDDTRQRAWLLLSYFI